MLTQFHAWISGINSWATIGWLFVGMVVCVVLFQVRQKTFKYKNELLDSRRSGYSVEEVTDLMQELEELGVRKAYAITQLTLDLAFPILYGLFFACLMAKLYSASSSQILLLLAILAVLADVTENAISVYLALAFQPELEPGVSADQSSIWRQAAQLGSIFTQTKFAFFTASTLVVLVGLVGQIYFYFWPPKKLV